MPVTQVKNNTNRNNAVSFKAIKSVKFRGLYKNNPELSKNLVDAFMSSPTAMAFCKEHDVDIVFYADKHDNTSTSSSVHIFYDNPVRSRFKKFVDFLNGKKEEISIDAYEDEYDLAESLAASTKVLIKRMTPSTKSTSTESGMLDSNIFYANKQIQEALRDKLLKQSKKQAKITAKQESKEKIKNDKEILNNSIQNLIDKSK